MGAVVAQPPWGALGQSLQATRVQEGQAVPGSPPSSSSAIALGTVGPVNIKPASKPTIQEAKSWGKSG